MLLRACEYNFEEIMFLSSRLITILLLMPPMASMAQQHPDPVDPAANGQPVAYVSVFAAVPVTPQSEQTSPDKSWILHNRQLMPAAKAAVAGPAPAPIPTPSPPHQHGSRGQGS